MKRKFIFTDEAGCFTFNREPNVSRFFIVCTVVMDDCEVASELLELRRKLAWEGADLNDYFHATSDKQSVRDRVYEAMMGHVFSIQATIMEKSKANFAIRRSKPSFYKTGFYFHFKNGVAPLIAEASETLMTAACLGSRRERSAFQDAISDVMRQTHNHGEWKADFLPCQADPCLQVADYCAWAIQRKWERDDLRSYDIIKDRITYEYDLWKSETKQHY